MGGQSVDFLLDTGATYSVLTEAPGPLSSRSASVVDCLGSPLPTLLCLFGQSLSRDLQNLNSSEAEVLQYVDDILLCAETEEACSRASEDFLNFLAGCGYKASREKAQLCQQSVRYLGLIISEGSRATGPQRIEPKLNQPLPMTLKQLRGFLGIIGYC